MQAQPPAGLCLNLQASRLRGFIDPLFFCLKFLLFPSTRSGRAGPLLSGQQKVGKDWPKRAAPPLGFPLCGRAGAAFGRNSREWSDGTPSRLRGRSFREICGGVAAKAVSDAVPCAFAHDRQTFPNGERGGQGGVSPHPEAVEVRQPWRARTRSRPSPTAPKLQPRSG